MPFPLLAPLVMAAGSAIGGALANRGQKQKSTTTPAWGEEYGPLQKVLMNSIMARLSQPGGLPPGYEAGQTLGINKTFDLAGQSLANRMAARGLGRSPITGAGTATLETGRAGSLAEMQRSLPLLERQLRNQDLGMGSEFLGMGRGQTVEGETSGNMLGGGLTSMGTTLAYLYGQGMLGGGESPLATRPTGVGNIGGLYGMDPWLTPAPPPVPGTVSRLKWPQF